MNLLNLGSIFFATFIMVFAMVYGNPAPLKMFDFHAMMIVLGGTTACIGVAFSLPRAASMVKIFFRGLFKTTMPKDINKKIIAELMQFAEAHRSDSPELPKMIENCQDPFMKEALTAMTDGVLDSQKLIRVLHARVGTIYHRYSDDAKIFVSCGKFPPAMGLMGAVTGMILLLRSLGEPGAEKHVGPNMSVALVATLYGIALANLFIIPIGEHLQEIAKKLKLKNTIIVEGIRLIEQRQNPVVLAEELNSYLLPSERLDWKAIGK